MPDPNVIFLFGDDEYAIQQRLDEFAAMFGDASQREMNLTRLEARTMTDDDLHNAVGSLPFLAKQRLVMLAHPSRRYGAARRAERGQGENEGEAQPEPAADSRKKFLEFLGRVPPTTRLVIWEEVPLRYKSSRAEQDQEDDKHWLVKWFRKSGLGLERFALPSPGAMPAWITRAVKAQGGEINHEAAQGLAALLGSDTRQAAQEITKLLTYVNWSRPITTADVRALTTLTAEPDIFHMVDHMAAGEGGKALRLLKRLLDNQDAFSTWGMIIRQFRLLLLAREHIDGGGRREAAGQAMGVAPYVAGKAFDQAHRFTLPALEKIYHRLLEIDEDAKTGRMPLEVSLDLLVAELAAK